MSIGLERTTVFLFMVIICAAELKRECERMEITVESVTNLSDSVSILKKLITP